MSGSGCERLLSTWQILRGFALYSVVDCVAYVRSFDSNMYSSLCLNNEGRQGDIAQNMSQNNQRLSYEELVSLLQRSTALQSKQSAKEFTPQDLLDIAQELGIESHLVQKVVEEHLDKRSSLKSVSRPFDTKVTIASTPSSLDLKVPSVGLKGGSIFSLVFVAFWLTFVAVWTFFASRGGIIFALFSVPFWFVGGAMLWRILKTQFSSTHLHLERGQGVLDLTPFGKQHTLHTEELDVVLTKKSSRQKNFTSGMNQTSNQVLQLQHGVKSFDLMEGYSEQEQEWVESELKRWLL